MIATKSNPINPTDTPLNGPGEDDIPAIVALLFFAHRDFTADTTLERHGLGRIRHGVVFLAGRGSRPSANKLPTTLKLETQNPKRARARPAREGHAHRDVENRGRRRVFSTDGGQDLENRSRAVVGPRRRLEEPKTSKDFQTLPDNPSR